MTARPSLRVMRGDPLEGSFVAVGGRSFGFGPGLGRPVRAALPAFRTAIEAALIGAAALPRYLRHLISHQPRTGRSRPIAQSADHPDVMVLELVVVRARARGR